MYRIASADTWRESNSSDAYSRWLVAIEKKQGVSTDTSLISSSLSDIITALSIQIPVISSYTYLLCNSQNESVSAAITVAAAGEKLLIAGDSSVASAFDAANISRSADLSSSSISSVLVSSPDIINKLSSSIFIFQDLGKSQFLADYAIFSRAVYMEWNDAARTTVVANKTDGGHNLGATFGWGPENDYVSTLNQHSFWVHASDYNKNLPVLSNTPLHVAAAMRTKPVLQTAAHHNTVKHTVAFLMSDGDNLQWTLGGWSTDPNWYIAQS